MKPILDNMAYVREVEKARAEAIAYNKSHTRTDQTKGREVPEQSTIILPVLSG